MDNFFLMDNLGRIDNLVEINKIDRKQIRQINFLRQIRWKNLGRIDNLVEINKNRIFKINKLDKIDKSFFLNK